MHSKKGNPLIYSALGLGVCSLDVFFFLFSHFSIMSIYYLCNKKVNKYTKKEQSKPV